MKVVVSVLMPVLNCGRYLDDAIWSIRRQTFTEFEFIIVNDGSTDDSGAKIRMHAREDRRIKVIEQENAGIVQALNNGLAACSGEFVARMDGDDVALPSRLAMQVKRFHSDPDLDCVGCWVSCINESGARCGVWRNPLSSCAVNLSLVTGASIIHPTSMIRRSSLVRIGGWKAEWSEDHELWCRMSQKEMRLINLRKPLLMYRTHQANHSKCKDHLQALIRRGKQQLEFVLGSTVDEASYGGFARSTHGHELLRSRDAEEYLDVSRRLLFGTESSNGLRLNSESLGVILQWDKCVIRNLYQSQLADKVALASRVARSALWLSCNPLDWAHCVRPLARIAKTFARGCHGSTKL